MSSNVSKHGVIIGIPVHFGFVHIVDELPGYISCPGLKLKAATKEPHLWARYPLCTHASKYAIPTHVQLQFDFLHENGSASFVANTGTVFQLRGVERGGRGATMRILETFKMWTTEEIVHR